MDAEIENIQIVNVHKTGRTTGHTTGKMFTNLQPAIVTDLFDEEKTVDVLVVTGDNGDFGKSLFVKFFFSVNLSSFNN